MNKKIPYYLIYKKEEYKKYLYAYSTDKDTLIRFLKYRDLGQFSIKKKKCDLLEREYISSEYSGMRIYDRKFIISREELVIPVTLNEMNYIEYISYQLDIFLTSNAVISPFMFKPVCIRNLQLIRYNEFFLKYEKGTDADLLNDEFMIFAKQFGDTLDLDKVKDEVFSCKST